MKDAVLTLLQKGVSTVRMLSIKQMKLLFVHIFLAGISPAYVETYKHRIRKRQTDKLQGKEALPIFSERSVVPLAPAHSFVPLPDEAYL